MTPEQAFPLTCQYLSEHPAWNEAQGLNNHRAWFLFVAGVRINSVHVFALDHPGWKSVMVDKQRITTDAEALAAIRALTAGHSSTAEG